MGFKGVIGDSNTPCINTTSSTGVATGGGVGASCTLSRDCLFNICTDQRCGVAILMCPSNMPDVVCSGHGKCEYSDPSGNVLKSCTVLENTCTAACLCDVEFGGQDCSLDAAETSQKDAVRTALCQAIIDSSLIQDDSFALLMTLIHSLLSSFNSIEVTSTSGVAACAEALVLIATLSSRGFLAGDRVVTQALTDVISEYTVKSTSSIVRRQLASTNDTQYPVDMAVSSLVQGVFLGMTPGETPVTLASPNVQVAVSNMLLTDLVNTSFSSPSTEGQAFYGSIPPRLTLGPSGLSSCYSSTAGYAELSILQWSNNPYTNSQSIQSPLIRFSTQSTRVTENTTISNIIPPPGVPEYVVTLQFSVIQAFNFTAGISGSRQTNFTLPACTVYDGVDYVACSGCNISSYTNSNVTYSCFDMTQLCPSRTASRAASVGRALESEGRDHNIHSGNKNLRRLRRLVGASDIVEDVSTYGVLLDSIQAELSSTLSSNPFAINLSKAVAILSFMGGLVGFIVISLVILLRVDYREKLHKLYVKNEHRAQARKLFRADIHKGDLGATYAAYIKQFKSNYKESRSLRSSCSVHNKHTTDAKIDVVNCNDNDEEEEREKVQSYTHMAMVVVDFLNGVIPSRNLFQEHQGNFLNSIVRNHDYFRTLSGSTMNLPRYIRFLGFDIIILSELFVDTLFFGIFYPSDGTCDVYSTEITCTALTSKISSTETQCTWNSATSSCAVTEPPTSLAFIVIVGLITTILQIPLFLAFLLERYAAVWPGNTGGYQEKINAKKDRGLGETGLKLREATNKYLFGEVIDKAIKDGGAQDSYNSADIAQITYSGFTSVAEEAVMLMDRVRAFLFKGNMEDGQLPYEALKATDRKLLARDAKMLAIEEELGIRSDGTLVPLTLRQRMFFGNADARLIYKLSKVREKTAVVVETLGEFEDWEVELKDTRLIRFFLVECLSPLKRIAFSMSADAFDDRGGLRKPSWFLYITSWVLITGSLVFYLYWVFAWGVKNGGETLKAWGSVFGWSAGSDIILVSITKIVILQYLPTVAMQPQLRRVRRVLADLSMDYLNRHDHYDGRGTVGGVEEEEELRVIQHMSAACRASHEESVRTLPSAWLLRQADDRDVAECREGGLDYGSIISLLVILPLSLMLFNETIGHVFIDYLIPSVFSGVLLVGEAMLSVSVALLVVPLMLIVGVPLYVIFLYRPAKLAVFRRLEIRKAYWDKVDSMGQPVAISSRRPEATDAQSSNTLSL